MSLPVWQKAKIIQKNPIASDIISLQLQPEIWTPHKAGQYYQLRLMGDEISRSYSVVSSPLTVGTLEFGIQLIPGGAFSPRLCRLDTGDSLEIRGPLGQNFVWEKSDHSPLVLLGAGSGMAPLLSIYRHFRAVHPRRPVVFIVSVKSLDRIMYYRDYQSDLTVRVTSSEGRIDVDFLRNVLGDSVSKSKIYICGSISFLDDMMDHLLALGALDHHIKAERFI